MYVACMLCVCIMMIQVGLARPGALASLRLAAAAPGSLSGCAVTRTRTYVTLIAVQVEHAT